MTLRSNKGNVKVPGIDTCAMPNTSNSASKVTVDCFAWGQTLNREVHGCGKGGNTAVTDVKQAGSTERERIMHYEIATATIYQC